MASKQPHIHADGIYEIWRDETARQAYHRIFDDAVERYNARQKRADRKITNYYSQIEKNEKKHPVYEMIIGIYGKDEYGYPICSSSTGYEIMKEFFQGWDTRNPNLELIGAYYHADEDGEPHVHLDYIPVAHGYKNGMDTQNGLVKALGEMGFFKSGKETAQIQWEARENRLLEDLCRSKNLTVDHPEKDGSNICIPTFTKRSRNWSRQAKICIRPVPKTNRRKDSLQSFRRGSRLPVMLLKPQKRKRWKPSGMRMPQRSKEMFLKKLRKHWNGHNRNIMLRRCRS